MFSNATLSFLACYRIMEAALEQACNQEELQTSQCSKSSSATLSKQQTSQVLRVLEEAFSAQIYYLQQVRGGNAECQILTIFGFQQELNLRALFLLLSSLLVGRRQSLWRPLCLRHIPIPVLLAGRGNFLPEGGSDSAVALPGWIRAQPHATGRRPRPESRTVDGGTVALRRNWRVVWQGSSEVKTINTMTLKKGKCLLLHSQVFSNVIVFVLRPILQVHPSRFVPPVS